jgi:hypothetical protein
MLELLALKGPTGYFRVGPAHRKLSPSTGRRFFPRSRLAEARAALARLGLVGHGAELVLLRLERTTFCRRRR